MVGPQWSDDPDTPALQGNLDKVAQDVVLDAFGVDPLDADLIKTWHAAMYDGIPVPCDAYLGKFRGDSSHSELLDAENRVYGLRGVRSYLVYGEVAKLLTTLRTDVERLSMSGEPQIEQDMEALRIAAYAHGEWVRIHPFVNGNGRTARFIVMWVLARFRIPSLLPVRPRPGPPYDAVAKASMTAEHEPFELYLRDLYAALSRKQNAAPEVSPVVEKGER